MMNLNECLNKRYVYQQRIGEYNTDQTLIDMISACVHRRELGLLPPGDTRGEELSKLIANEPKGLFDF